MSEFKIEKNISQPPSPNSKYPFKSMEIGDSFTFDVYKVVSVRNASGIFSGKNKGYKFMTRKISETKGRIWRVEIKP